jgi:hypothetical protein
VTRHACQTGNPNSTKLQVRMCCKGRKYTDNAISLRQTSPGAVLPPPGPPPAWLTAQSNLAPLAGGPLQHPHVQPQLPPGPSAGGAQPELQAADMVKLLLQYQQYTGMPNLSVTPPPLPADAAAAPASALAVAPRVPSSSGSDNAAGSQAQMQMPPSTGSGSPSHRHRGRVKQTHQTAQKRYRDRQRVRGRPLCTTSHTVFKTTTCL